MNDHDASLEPSPARTPACALCGETTHRKLFRKDDYDFVRCSACRLVRLDPIPDEKTLAAFYEASYDGGAYGDWGAKYDIRLAHAKTRVGIVEPHAPEGPWLDIGCSTGAFLDAASQRGFDVEGIDVSESAVEVARSRGFRAHHASAETFSPDRKYAYITGFDVLEHVPDPAGLLDRLHDWLAPGGRIALTVPDIASFQARVMGRHWYYYAAPYHLTYFNRETATRMLEHHHFHPISISAAPKVMTIDYVTAQFEFFNPWLHRIVAAVSHLLPASVRTRELPMPTGEILVVASA